MRFMVAENVVAITSDNAAVLRGRRRRRRLSFFLLLFLHLLVKVSEMISILRKIIAGTVYTRADWNPDRAARLSRR